MSKHLVVFLPVRLPLILHGPAGRLGALISQFIDRSILTLLPEVRIYWQPSRPPVKTLGLTNRLLNRLVDLASQFATFDTWTSIYIAPIDGNQPFSYLHSIAFSQFGGLRSIHMEAS